MDTQSSSLLDLAVLGYLSKLNCKCWLCLCDAVPVNTRTPVVELLDMSLLYCLTSVDYICIQAVHVSAYYCFFCTGAENSALCSIVI